MNQQVLKNIYKGGKMKKNNHSQKLTEGITMCRLESIFDSKIEEHCRFFSFEKGEMICQKGISADYIFFLIKGKTKIFINLSNGKNYLLRVEDPISLYGDIELFESKIYVANVQALTDCECIGIPFSIIESQYLVHAPFLNYACHTLGQRLNTISLISAENLLLSLKQKVAGYLLLYVEVDKDIELIQNYQDIAEQLGTSYRHLSRTFKELEEDQILKKNGKCINILDLESLKRLGHEVYSR